MVLAGRNQSALEETAQLSQKESDNSLVIPTDIRDEYAVKSLFKRTNDHFERIDLVFNNAGIAGPPDLLEDLEQRLAAAVDCICTYKNMVRISMMLLDSE